MSNSSLVSYTKLSPNHSGPRTHSIDRISPHCVVGQVSVETLGAMFAKKSKEASSNYGIGADGRVAMYVEEHNRSWCTSNNANDQRAVTIECASDAKHPYAFRTEVYDKLIELCVDICRRNGKTKLLWFGDKTKTLKYQPESDEMVLTVHRWFAKKSCPGDWMYARMGDLAEKVTKQLGESPAPAPKPEPEPEPATNLWLGHKPPFLVRVSCADLYLRRGPGIANYGRQTIVVNGKKTQFCPVGVYTITDVKQGEGYYWGELKSSTAKSPRWIALDYTEYVKGV